MMISQSIKKRFSKRPRNKIYTSTSDLDWINLDWQLKNAVHIQQDFPITIVQTAGQKSDYCFATPYYLNLCETNSFCPIAGIISSQFALGHLDHQAMFNADDDFIEHIKNNNKENHGITEIDLPLLSVCPHRVTDQLLNKLQTDDCVIININIHHPLECTQELFEACSRLADAGFIINNKMTFLKGINDSAEVVKELNLKLLMMRVRPYLIYLHENNLSSDLINVKKSVGIEILDHLRGWTSGLAVPHLIYCDGVHSPRPVLPDYIKESTGESYVFRNYKNKDFRYINSVE